MLNVPQAPKQPLLSEEEIKAKIAAIYDEQEEEIMDLFEEDDVECQTFTELKTLSFFGYDIDDNLINRIFENLPGTAICKLNFSNANFLAQSFNTFVEALKTYPINEVDLSCTNLPPEAYQYLAQNLNGCQITDIDISNNATLAHKIW